MFCCASKKAVSAVAEPVYGFEPESVVKKAEPVAEDAKPADVEETAMTQMATIAVQGTTPPASPQKQPNPDVPPLQEPHPLQTISMQLGNLFEKVAESARGIVEKVAAPAAAPPVSALPAAAVAAPAASAPAAAAFETSSESVEDATEMTTTPAAAPAPASAPAAPAPAADVVQSL